MVCGEPLFPRIQPLPRVTLSSSLHCRYLEGLGSLMESIPAGNVLDVAERLLRMGEDQYRVDRSVQSAFLYTTMIEKCVEKVGWQMASCFEAMEMTGLEMLYFCHHVLNRGEVKDACWNDLQVAITRFWLLLVDMDAQSVAQVLKEWYAALIARKEEHIPDIRPILLHFSPNATLDFGDISPPALSETEAVPGCCTFILPHACLCLFDTCNKQTNPSYDSFASRRCETGCGRRASASPASSPSRWSCRWPSCRTSAPAPAATAG